MEHSHWKDLFLLLLLTSLPFVQISPEPAMLGNVIVWKPGYSSIFAKVIMDLFKARDFQMGLSI